MDKFKVGDKVRSKCYGEGKVVEEMGGEILVQFEKSNSNLHSARFSKTGPYRDNTCYWYKRDTNQLKIVKDKYTYEDLKKSPIGTKVTFENDVILVKTTEKRLESKLDVMNIENLKNLKDDYYGKIIKIEEPTYKTVYKCKEEILDEAEKRYLKAVIRPFRARMKYVMKEDINYATKEYIRIDLGREMINLPKFDSGSMYKGMKLNKGYTLEELGL